MPRQPVAIPDPVAATTVGQHLAVTRTGPGAAGVKGVYVYPNDPDGPFAWDASQLSGADQAALAQVHAAVVVLYRAARGYV